MVWSCYSKVIRYETDLGKFVRKLRLVRKVHRMVKCTRSIDTSDNGREWQDDINSHINKVKAIQFSGKTRKRSEWLYSAMLRNKPGGNLLQQKKKKKGSETGFLSTTLRRHFERLNDSRPINIIITLPHFGPDMSPCTCFQLWFISVFLLLVCFLRPLLLVISYLD